MNWMRISFDSIQFSWISNPFEQNTVKCNYGKYYISDIVNAFRILAVIELHATLAGHSEISGIVNENIVPKRVRNKRILL